MCGPYQPIVAPRECTSYRPHSIAPLLRHQRGVFAVMTALLILVILGFAGLAVDLGRVINRKVELQGAAEAIALVAAKELDGTDAGINRATSFAAQMAANILYNYNASSVEWSNNAIRFGSTPYGSTWLDATTAAQPANAANLYYVRVDTSRLNAHHGNVGLTLLRVLPSIGTTAQISSVATAGRSSINVMPLAICAMSEAPAQARGTELVEYGFRRGISYDLMNLNSKENAKGAHYLINPIALPGTAAASVKNKMEVIRPFVCTGTVAIPGLTGANITVEADFPLASVYEQLNSRFGFYSDTCTANSAPPDTNVQEFSISSGFSWMNDAPSKQSADPRTTSTQLLTIADLPAADIPESTLPGMYGPLWIYAKPAKYASYRANASEPANGYATFNANDAELATLYPRGSPKIKSGFSYPSPSPYAQATSVSNKRRVLNIPLLQCPVLAGPPMNAVVLGIGKFFMTVSADDEKLYGEFAGAVPRTSVVGEVELYP